MFAVANAVGARRRSLAHSLPAPVEDVDLALTAPVGVARDPAGNVWLADTGAGRVLVFDGALDRLLAVVGDGDPVAFDLPFRLAHHPTEDAVLVTDVGDGRLVRLTYENAQVPTVVAASTLLDGTGVTGPFHPNGIAGHDYADGLRWFVSDEFYHDDADGDALRSRVLVVDDDGSVRDQFRTVRADGPDQPLYWPQGLATDAEGRLYIANTGAGLLDYTYGAPAYYATVLRCDRTGRGVPFAETWDPTLAEFIQPRDVAVASDGSILVADAAMGRISVYSPAGDHLGTAPEPPSLFTSEQVANCKPESGPAGDGRDRPRQLAGPVSLTPGPPTGQETIRVVAVESLGDRIGQYTLDPAAERATRGRVAGTPRSDPADLHFPTGAVVLSALEEGPLADATLVTDAGNRRLQYIGPDGARRALPLSDCRFPFGIAFWPTAPDRGRLFVSDYDVAYRRFDDSPQIHVYEIAPSDDTVAVERVAGFGHWGLGDDEFKLPRGIGLASAGADRLRAYIADSANGRVGVWRYDLATDTATNETERGRFGHIDGSFWNPADVAVGEHGVYVADENNNRLQRFDGERWHSFGEAGYATGGERFLLPIGVAAHEGLLFVVDLVNRAIRVYAERSRDPILEPVDALARFGGDADAGELWFPYMPGVGTPHSSTDADAAVVVPDATAGVAYRYHWTDDR